MSSSRTMRVLAVCLAGLLVAGCESMQKKFTRKRRTPVARPNPIINFLDYSRAMTPMDRYRKHYLMFDYWNDQLLQALSSPPINPKRFKQSSAEAVTELQTMRMLLNDEAASKLSPHVDARIKLNEELQRERADMNSVQASALRRRVEEQTRSIQRGFSWQDMRDSLKE